MIGSQPDDDAAGGVVGHHRGGPTVLRIVLGSQLRRLREERHITCEEAGRAIRGSHSKISRLELGRVRFRHRDVTDLLTFYGITDEKDQKAMLALADRANEPGWWHSYSDILPSWFEVYIGLEEAASRIRTYEVQFVPGLLQTEDYARAVVSVGSPQDSDQDVEAKVRVRMERQRILDREKPPTLWAVIDEAALRRPMGGRRVMRGQIEHLLDLMKRPNISVQVVPFRQGGHAAESGAFTILRFDGEDLPDVVYLEQLVSALYLDKVEQVDRYAQTMVRLTAEAPPPEDTVDLLTKILEQS
jgi:transcriptional regulator with XRE-family HTH domain